ncbi:MAG: hypothetical protein J6Y32_02665 [Bacteroidales bacterium]|nr:hypothetical protein [Bacteroidales bacterium]
MLERRQNRFSRPRLGAEDSSASPDVRTPERETAPAAAPQRNGGNNGGGGSKTAVTVLVIIALLLAGVLAYIWYSKQRLVDELDAEKQELTNQMKELQADYRGLTSDYASINAQLDSSREEVNQLIERIQKTEATNRAAIRKYEKELGTLRSIMKSYIVQIDSLNTANKKLRADLSDTRKDLSESQRKNEELTQTVGDLSDKVAAGSVIKARGIRLEGQRKNGKKTDRAGQTVFLLTSLSLIENDLAPKGPMMVYAIVRNEAGDVLTNPDQPTSFVFDGVETLASAGREVDYEGAEIDLSIYLTNLGKLAKGPYSVEVFTEKYRLGGAEVLLR